MTDFAECSGNHLPITPAQLCEGFAKCGAAGIPMNSAGMNAVVRWLEDLIAASALDLTDCNGNPIASGDAIATCADVAVAIAAAIAALPGDKFLQGLGGYDALTNTLTLNMSDGSTVDVGLTGLIADGVATAIAAATVDVVNTFGAHQFYAFP